VKRALLLAVAVALLAGCGGSDDAATAEASVYVLRDGKVWPVAREVDGDSPEASALEALFEGPTDEEQEALGATTAISGGGPTLTIEEGVARVEPAGQYTPEALAQIVYTLTQFDTIEAVEVDERYTRADFEEQTPSVLVESPLPFEEVSSPLRSTGTANTFEATFEYELLDGEGDVVAKDFVTATSGTGTRGTFDFTTDEFDEVATLVVYESSAEDGSRIHEVEIPLATAS
jgi:hypothetical protein